MQDISEDVIRRAAKGDIRAFEEIYRISSAFVYHVALRFTHHTAIAEEVTQDVFLKIHRNLASFKSESSLKTWIYKITMNTALNYEKRKSRETRLRVDFDSVIVTKEAKEETGADLVQAEKRDFLHQLLAQLNPDQRSCILLRELEGLEYLEIAKALGININTVRSRLKRARENLSAYVRKEAICHEV